MQSNCTNAFPIFRCNRPLDEINDDFVFSTVFEDSEEPLTGFKRSLSFSEEFPTEKNDLEEYLNSSLEGRDVSIRYENGDKKKYILSLDVV